MTAPEQPREQASAADGTAPTFRISAVARRIGVSTATIRTWERRYDLGPQSHDAGCHRQYTAADVHIYVSMKQLISQGMSTGEAARAVKQMSAQDLLQRNVSSEPADESVDQRLPAFPDFTPTEKAAQGPLDGNLSSLAPLPRRLIRLAQNYDVDRLRCLVASELASSGTVEAWNSTILPALIVVGRHWAVTGRGIDIEHILTEGVRGALSDYAIARAGGQGLVLLAGAPNERHDLPLCAVGAAVTERGLRYVCLGPSTPCEALASAAGQLQPDALLVVSLVGGAEKDAHGLRSLVSEYPTMLAGPGWLGLDVPAEAAIGQSLEESVAFLLKHAPIA